MYIGIHEYSLSSRQEGAVMTMQKTECDTCANSHSQCSRKEI